jgi:hypothetical protein
MALQTTYTQFQPAGFPGMSANMEEWNGITRTATATIAFGAPAQRSGDTQCAPLTTGEFIGIAVAHHVLTSTNADSYGQYDNVPLADEGGRQVDHGSGDRRSLRGSGCGSRHRGRRQ